MKIGTFIKVWQSFNYDLPYMEMKNETLHYPYVEIFPETK